MTSPDPRFQIDRDRRWTVSENRRDADGCWMTAFRDPTDEEWASLTSEGRMQLLRHSHAAEIMEMERQLAAAESQREALRAALSEIRDKQGKVCDQYEVCEHTSCASSYSAWAIADAALKEQPRISPETRARVDREMKDDLWARLGREDDTRG